MRGEVKHRERREESGSSSRGREMVTMMMNVNVWIECERVSELVDLLYRKLFVCVTSVTAFVNRMGVAVYVSPESAEF